MYSFLQRRWIPACDVLPGWEGEGREKLMTREKGRGEERRGEEREEEKGGWGKTFVE